jgi:hypothetical protein
LISWSDYANATADLFFCMAHWLLSVYYQKASKNVPMMMKGEDIVETNCTKIYTWIGVVLSVLLPSCEGFFTAKSTQNFYSNELFYAASVAYLFVQLLLVFTGVILIISMGRIYSFMKRHPEGDSADVKAMIIHSCAFWLFLISAIIIAALTMIFGLFR